MRKIVERSLRQAGLDLGDVVEAGNGIEALAAVREGAFDLILSDINMPAMDGLEFLRQLAKIEGAKGTPVVMVTTEGSESRVVEALSIGAKGYLRKPFTPDQNQGARFPPAGGAAMNPHSTPKCKTQFVPTPPGCLFCR
jgi:two-component system chemotaxis response regulator CheY